MAWIIGRKSDLSLVEITNNSFATLQRLETVFPQKFGGVASDYSYLDIDEVTFARISNGDSYTLDWSGTDLTGVDFTTENTKLWVKLATDKTVVLGDNIDSATITLEVWNAGLTTIRGNVNVTGRRVPILTPDGLRYVRFNISSGVGTATFKTNKTGQYTFPAESKRFDNFRIFNQINIEVDDVTLLELL